jgi:SAM-dependent methyltransferase
MQPFDDLARDYEKLLRDPLRDRFASGSDFFIEQKARIVLSRLAALNDEQRRERPLRVLDAGCGRGTAFQFFGPEIRVFGCDVSALMLQGATRHRPVAIQEPYALPFADNTFDAAYAMCVYHHIPLDEQLGHLRELRRVVAEGGEVMVFEHNPYNPVTARVFRRAPIDAGCEMITPPALVTLFEHAGFNRIDRGYLLFVPEAMHRLLPFIEPALAWLPLGGQYYVAGRK